MVQARKKITMTDFLDADDIIRPINTENQEAVETEIDRLWFRKRIGLKAHFTRNKNSFERIVVSAMYGRLNPEEDGPFDTTKSTRDQLHTSFMKLEASYEKLSRLHSENS